MNQELRGEFLSKVGVGIATILAFLVSLGCWPRIRQARKRDVIRPLNGRFLWQTDSLFYLSSEGDAQVELASLWGLVGNVRSCLVEMVWVSRRSLVMSSVSPLASHPPVAGEG